LAASPLATVSSHDQNNDTTSEAASIIATTRIVKHNEIILTYPYNTKQFNNSSSSNKETRLEMETFFHKYKHYLLNLDNLNETIFPSAESLSTPAQLLTTSTSQIMSINSTSKTNTATTTTSSLLIDLKNFKENIVYKGRNYTLFNVTIGDRQQQSQANDNNDQFNPLLSIGN